MFESILKSKFEAAGVSYGTRHGYTVPQTADLEKEYSFIREGAALLDSSYMNRFTIPEEEGLDFLNEVFAGDVESLRFGRVLNTFLADSDGNLVADVYIANNDEEFILLCESLVDEAELHRILFEENEGEKFGLKEISSEYALIGIDGFESWRVCKDVFGVNILGLPYLSIEEFDGEGDSVINIIRAGKTGEFGYLILVPETEAATLFDTLYDKVQGVNGGLCGVAVHDCCRLDGRFFNIYAEGAVVKNPLYLGLQWMIDLENIQFQGSDSIVSQRDVGVDKKIVGTIVDSNDLSVSVGDTVYDEEGEIGTFVSVTYSYFLKKTIGLVLMKTEYAYAGLEYFYGSSEGEILRTISMPPFSPKSLSVKLN